MSSCSLLNKALGTLQDQWPLQWRTDSLTGRQTARHRVGSDAGLADLFYTCDPQAPICDGRSELQGSWMAGSFPTPCIRIDVWGYLLHKRITCLFRLPAQTMNCPHKTLFPAFCSGLQLALTVCLACHFLFQFHIHNGRGIKTGKLPRSSL